MLKKLIYILFLNLICNICNAAQAIPVKIIQTNSLEKAPKVFVTRQFKEDLNQKYNGSDFDYTTTKPRESLWTKFKYFLSKIIRKILHNANPETINKVTKIVLYVFCGIIVFVLLYYLMKALAGKEGNFFFSKKNKKVEIHSEDVIEDINEIDFGKTIAQYELKKDYRSAFRYQFLALLKHLTDLKKIEWTQEKTNWDYLNELNYKEEQKYFERTIYIFDHVWYGDFKITAEDYHQYTEELNVLKTQSNE